MSSNLRHLYSAKSEFDENYDIENQTPNINNPRLPLSDHRAKVLRRQILYQAALKDEWEEVKPLLEEYKSIVCEKITERGETVLHVAAQARSTNFVQGLVNLMDKQDLELPNNEGSTAFYFAAATGVVEIAKAMREMNEKLPDIPDNVGTTPITTAALLGNKAMVLYLYDVTRLDELKESERFALLEATIQNDMYDVASKIFKKYRSLATRIEDRRSILNVLAKKPLAINKRNVEGKQERFNCIDQLDARILQTCSPVWGKVINTISSIPFIPWFKRFRELQEESLLKKRAGLLLEDLWEECLKLPDEELLERVSKTEILHSAAKAGNVEFLVVILRKHLDLIWKVDGKKRTVFHVAVLNREEKVFSLIRQIGAIKELITLNVDADENTILHLAGKLGKPMSRNAVYLESYQQLLQKMEILQQRLQGEPARSSTETGEELHKTSNEETRENLSREIEVIKRTIETEYIKEEERTMPRSFLRVSGAALRLQREILWFKEVEKIVPPLILGMKNKDGKTPWELFSEEHQMLLKEGERWMKDTANSCMIVATLIATVVFAAAFTVPGGNNNDEGTPIMLKLKGFTIFVVSDAVAFFSAILSIIMFLSILTSRYTEDDFLVSLPKKLLYGLTALFISIVSMLVGFAATFFLVYTNHMAWQPKLIAACAGIPVILFGSLQYKLWFDTAKSTYWSKFLFKPGKHKLY
ncbi:unnamed protein product [Withania somnifera]